MRQRTVGFWLVLLFAGLCRADDITGVQPAALDQPRIYLNVRRTAGAAPLTAKSDGQQQAAVEAFLDTGASSIVLSSETFKALGIHQTLAAAAVGAATTKPAQPAPAEYEDVGVGGSEKFFISEPLLLSFAAYSSNSDGSNDAEYSTPAGPMRVELRPSGGLLEMITGGLDVAGMPAMTNKVIVIDPKPLNSFADKLRTSLCLPGDASVPKTTRHVPLTYVSFERFTRMTPGAAPPNTATNPMIGPNPFKPADAARPVTAGYLRKTTSLTMLLDTGAVCSMISRKQAEKLGVTYSADDSKLLGVPQKEQFALTVGGIGGSKSACGFYLDHLTLPTRKGEEPISYAKAPVLVNDITLADPVTHETYTLPGVFGMNFLVASANVTGGLLPDIGNLTEGPFTAIVIDHVHSTLGVTPR